MVLGKLGTPPAGPASEGPWEVWDEPSPTSHSAWAQQGPSAPLLLVVVCNRASFSKDFLIVPQGTL